MERIPVTGGELKGEAAGSGEPVLFIHGAIMADTYNCFRKEPALSSYQLISYRRRGFCDSAGHDGPCSIAQQAADAAAVLAHFGVDRAHVVGHSYGGCTALQLALDAPTTVHSLGLFEPPIMEVPAAEGFTSGVETIAAIWQSGDKEAATDAFLQAVGGPDYRPALDKTLAPGWFDQAVADIDVFFEVELPALGEWRFNEDDAKRITQPCLTVLGEESAELFVQGTAWLEDRLPAVTRCRLPAATHVLQLMNPTTMAESLATFLAANPL
jgi:pimeloyl-ACP methyl ester carboxylesterase